MKLISMHRYSDFVLANENVLAYSCV